MKETLLPTGTIRTLQTTLLGKNHQEIEAIIPPFVLIEKDISKDHNYDLIQYAQKQ